MTTSIPYSPQTERGTGVALPVSKAIWHAMAVFTAIRRTWPMTVEEARSELDEAANHIGDIQSPASLLSATTQAAIAKWNTEQQAIRTAIATLESANPDTILTNELLPADSLQKFIQSGWAFISLIDSELTGLTGAESDPGRVP